MADKKITALTELSATGKAGEDFLHIIDYGGGSSPVNKKISLTNLFNNANVDTHIYGASKTLEVGFAAATNSHLKVATGADATTDGSVVVNDDGTDYVDFIVKSKTSDQAIKVDSGTDKVIINGDAVDCDFTVSGENVAALLHVDAGLDAVGIVKAAPDTAYSLTVGATGTNGIKSEGSVSVTGSITATTSLSVGGVITQTGTPVATTGNASEGSATVIPIDTAISYLVSNGTMYFTLAAGTQGQLKTLIVTTGTGTPLAKVIGASGVNMHFGTANGTTAGTANTHLSLELEEAVLLQYLNTGWAIVGMGPTAAVGAS